MPLEKFQPRRVSPPQRPATLSVAYAPSGWQDNARPKISESQAIAHADMNGSRSSIPAGLNSGFMNRSQPGGAGRTHGSQAGKFRSFEVFAFAKHFFFGWAQASLPMGNQHLLECKWRMAQVSPIPSAATAWFHSQSGGPVVPFDPWGMFPSSQYQARDCPPIV